MLNSDANQITISNSETYIPFRLDDCQSQEAKLIISQSRVVVNRKKSTSTINLSLFLYAGAVASQHPVFSPMMTFASFPVPANHDAIALSNHSLDNPLSGVEFMRNRNFSMSSIFADPMVSVDALMYAPDVANAEEMACLCAQARAAVPIFQEEEEDDIPFDDAWV